MAALALAGALFTRTSAGAPADADAPADPGTPRVAPAPLPPLPELPDVELPQPDSEVVQRVDALLARFAAKDAATRESAVREILEVRADSVPVLAARLEAVAERADKSAMKNLLERARKKGRQRARERARDAGLKGKIETPDYLDLAVHFASPTDEAWRQLVSVLAMSRMLVRIGTIEAARELTKIYVRFGEFLRVDTQLRLAEMGDSGIAALIEARRHRARKVARWADKQLDLAGRAIPSEAVRTDNYDGLADILRAYGRIRDPDAARVVISFANSERIQLREAARQSVVMFGEVALWQLRDTFENLTGDRAPREWSWERVARELFSRFDAQRLARVYGLFEKGLGAQQQGDLSTMVDAFDAVLTRSPLFDRAAEMAGGYFEFATAAKPADRGRALVALRRVERISNDSELANRAKSLRLTLQGLDWLDDGLADRSLFERALELDPNNERAQAALRTASQVEPPAEQSRQRWGAAALIAGVALLAMAWLGLRRPSSSKQRPAPTAGDGACEPSPAVTQHQTKAPLQEVAQQEPLLPEEGTEAAPDAPTPKTD